ncbi:MAG: SMC domain-containing protein [Bacillota bacterium]|nr:MAG: SMC domain-containing protein [Bacillota bacterium]
MRLQSIELKNFRQFYGKQTLEFAGASMQDETNVTVIYGDNGRGKTGLFRALMFALFGERVLDQDKNYDQADSFDAKRLYLVNLVALEEDGRQGTEAYVKVRFAHDNMQYEMTRKLYGILSDDGIVNEEDAGLCLYIKDVTGNTKVLDHDCADDINALIAQILDRRVKDYFLFDGERIERLTKATTIQRKEIARGIKSLLRIDELFKAEEAVKLLDAKITKELEKVSTGEYRKKLQMRDELLQSEVTLENDLTQKEDERETAEEHLRLIDHELDRFKDKVTLLEKRKTLENRLETLRQHGNLLKHRMVEGLSFGGLVLSRDLLTQLYVEIDFKREKGQVPSDLKRELIDRLLNEMKCLCGRPIRMNSPEYHLLKAWETQVPTQQTQQAIMGLFGDLGASQEAAKNGQDVIMEVLRQVGTVDAESDQIRQELAEFAEELDGLPDSDFSGINKARATIQASIASLDHEVSVQGSELEAVRDQLAAVDRQLGPLERESKQHLELSYQRQVVAEAKQTFKTLIKRFTDEMRAQLEEKASHNMAKMLDSQGRGVLRAVKLDEQYTLEVLDWRDREFLANVSAGQRQIVSLSFILALAQVAGGAASLEIPLFMDTPFGRLSPEHRDNLLSYIPQVTPQWIMLATATEFTEKESRFLKDSGKWGRVYYLDSKVAGQTVAKEMSVESFRGLQKEGVTRG